MARKKKKKEEHECETAGGLRWLITYADMITLLLGVFIILVASSAISEEKFNAMRMAFARVFSLVEGEREKETLPGSLGSVFPDKSGAQVDFPEEVYRKEPIAKGYKDEKTQEKVKTIQTRKGTVFQLSDIMFEEGEASLNPKYSFELNRVGAFIERIPNEIRIEGHTDARPVKGRFSSNWELSLARANSVRKYLFDLAEKRLSKDEFEKYKNRFSIVGCGEGEPRVPDIYSPLNRRVDIVIIEVGREYMKSKILSE